MVNDFDKLIPPKTVEGMIAENGDESPVYKRFKVFLDEKYGDQLQALRAAGKRDEMAATVGSAITEFEALQEQEMPLDEE